MSITPSRLTSLDDVVRAVQQSGHSTRVAVARCADSFVLQAALDAHESGIAEPVLIGDIERTREVAEELGKDISGFQSIHCTDDKQAVFEAVRLYREREVSLIMKGLVATSILLKAVLNKETGVPPEGILSHVAVFKAVDSDRLMLLTDAGVNISPNLQRKIEILKNALKVARALGIKQPKCAMLAATEKVNYPAMPATLDADLISKMSQQGEFGDAFVAGPMALDIALSAQAAKTKCVENEVAGCADILCTPDIECGNVLYKSINTFAGVTISGVVVGSEVPVVVPSRGDSRESKYYSIALAAYLAEKAAEARGELAPAKDNA